MSNRPSHYQTRYQDDLTPRQREVLDLIARGLTNREIGERLGLTLDGAKWHVSEVIHKLGVQSREEAGEWWKSHRRRQRRGWLFAAIGHSAWAKIAVAASGGVLAAAAGGAFLLAGALDAPADITPPTPYATPTPTPSPPALPTIPDASEAVAVVIQAQDYPQDGPLALPLQASIPEELVTISAFLQLLASGPMTPVFAEQYLGDVPHANVRFTGGRYLNVSPAMDCVTTRHGDQRATTCTPVPGAVDILIHDQSSASGIGRIYSQDAYEWLKNGWRTQVRYGTQDEVNAIWDQP